MSDWRVVSYRLEVEKVNEVHEVVTPEKILQVLSVKSN